MHKLPKYYDSKQTIIQLGYKGDCIITPNDLMSKGVEIRSWNNATAPKIMLEENVNKHIWSFVENIFFDSFFAFYRFYNIRLRKNYLKWKKITVKQDLIPQ